jgi:hypothetical protein
LQLVRVRLAKNRQALSRDVVVPVCYYAIVCGTLGYFGGRMPFISDIHVDKPFEIRILENAYEILAIVPIGHDPDIGVQYNAHIALIRLDPFDGDYKAELMFDIGEVTSDRCQLIDNGLDTKRFLKGDDRRVTIETICDVTATIVERRQPNVIVMTTSQSNLPKKALVRIRTHNQNMTVAARAIAERKTVGDLS